VHHTQGISGFLILITVLSTLSLKECYILGHQYSAIGNIIFNCIITSIFYYLCFWNFVLSRILYFLRAYCALKNAIKLIFTFVMTLNLRFVQRFSAVFEAAMLSRDILFFLKVNA
jgi:hypothetical protein